MRYLRPILLSGALLICGLANGQPRDLIMGLVKSADFKSVLDVDTTGDAVVLDEKGQVFVDLTRQQVVTEYYIKIKILTPGGLRLANININIINGHTRETTEKLLSVQATAYNLQNGVIQETDLKPSDIFVKKSGSLEQSTFGVPGVREGTIFEVKYKISRPGLTIKRWEFQSELPKIHSELVTFIPLSCLYNIIIKGDLKLTNDETKIISQCYHTEYDCTYKLFAMDKVPAFKEESYMVGRKNYVSALQFDLAIANGQRLIQNWGSVDLRIMHSTEFGKQVLDGKKIYEPIVRQLAPASGDTLQYARAIFKYIQTHYNYNGTKSLFVSGELKKTIPTGHGNSTDINLSVIAALEAAGLKTTLLILSTSDNGIPNTLYPDLGEFNYLIAVLAYKGKAYFLDATDPLLTFGMLPLYCCNVLGHIPGRRDPVELTPEASFTIRTSADLVMKDNGSVSGTMVIRHNGYAALARRKELRALKSEQYMERIKQSSPTLECSKYIVENLDLPDSALVEKVDVVLTTDVNAGKNSVPYFNPFEVTPVLSNPLKNEPRQFPVDFLAPQQMNVKVVLTYPATWDIDELAKNNTFLTKDRRNRYIQKCGWNGNVLTTLTSLEITSAIIPTKEYESLRDFFSKVISSQQTRVSFQRKK